MAQALQRVVAICKGRQVRLCQLVGVHGLLMLLHVLWLRHSVGTCQLEPSHRLAAAQQRSLQLVLHDHRPAGLHLRLGLHLGRQGLLYQLRSERGIGAAGVCSPWSIRCACVEAAAVRQVLAGGRGCGAARLGERRLKAGLKQLDVDLQVACTSSTLTAARGRYRAGALQEIPRQHEAHREDNCCKA